MNETIKQVYEWMFYNPSKSKPLGIWLSHPFILRYSIGSFALSLRNRLAQLAFKRIYGKL